MPVELRTARWLVREQDTYLNNALIKKAEDEAQAYRAQIEDQIDAKLTEVLNKFEQINNFIETEKKSLRQPRKIVEPE